MLRNFKTHDDDSHLLLGYLKEDDQIHEAKQVSFLKRQITLF